MMLNIDFQPISRPRNYAPQRTFVTKWDVEIDRNRVKKINRGRDRTAKYFDDFDFNDFPVQPRVPRVQFNTHVDIISCDPHDPLDSDDGDETNSWLRSVHAENAYYDKMYDSYLNDELHSFQYGIRKRFYEFESEQSLFKRPRA